MREWAELEMSFSAGGFLSASDGYCSTEQLQYYGESTVTLLSLLLLLPLFFFAIVQPVTFSSPSTSVPSLTSLK